MFYDKFVLLCNSKNLTPCSVLNALQISKSCVTRWKNGGEPTDANCKKIADFFAVSMDELKKDNKQNEKNTNFYDKFLKLCNDAKIKPTEVALKLNLSKPAITRWKNGSLPRECTIKEISCFFDVPLEYFDKREKKHSVKSRSNKNNDDVKSTYVLELINVAQKLPTKKLKTLLNVAYAMEE